MQGLQFKNCSACATEFSRGANLSAAQWSSRMFCSRSCAAKKVEFDLHIAVSMYVQQRKSSTEIGDVLGISPTHVRRVLKVAGVKMRPATENKRLSAARPETRMKQRLARQGRRHTSETRERMRLVTGERHPLWKGGTTRTAQGYLQYTKSPANGLNAGQLVHHVVGLEKYGERVQPGRHLHHVDGNKLNNHPDNLLLMTDHAHGQWHAHLRNSHGK